MHRQEPVPQHISALVAFGWKAAVGAVLGFVCAVIIVGVNSSGTALLPGNSLSNTMIAAWKTGGLLGAMYLPLAAGLFLPKQNQAKTIAVASGAAILFGIVGDAAVGPWAPASISASLGFWLVTFGVYQHDHRSRTWRGRGSYLP